MSYKQEPFTPDILGSIVVPAHEDNVRPGENRPKVSVLHTPEEPADDVEVTPYYFSHQIWRPDGQGGWYQVRASTHGYSDSDGDLFQMVPERYGAIANGVRNKPYPADTKPGWSLNLQSRSLEAEGYARTIYRTMPRGGSQWNTTVRWVFAGYQMHDIPLDRAHVIGHYEVADNRTDPGTLDINAIVEDAIKLLAKEQNPAVLAGEDTDMALLIKTHNDHKSYLWTGNTRRHMQTATEREMTARLLEINPEPTEVTEEFLNHIPEVSA